jgi:hypothetical protein
MDEAAVEEARRRKHELEARRSELEQELQEGFKRHADVLRPDLPKRKRYGALLAALPTIRRYGKRHRSELEPLERRYGEALRELHRRGAGDHEIAVALGAPLREVRRGIVGGAAARGEGCMFCGTTRERGGRLIAGFLPKTGDYVCDRCVSLAGLALTEGKEVGDGRVTLHRVEREGCWFCGRPAGPERPMASDGDGCLCVGCLTFCATFFQAARAPDEDGATGSGLFRRVPDTEETG